MDSKGASEVAGDRDVMTADDALDDGGALTFPNKPPPMSTAHRRTLVFSLCANVFLAALDVTIIATALPTIATQLEASAAQYVWIGSSYTLAGTSMTPIWGKAFEIWGGKFMLILATIIFLGGSLIAAVGNSIGMLIGGRVVQGLGGGGINILVSILIGHLFPLSERGKYYGMTGVVWGVSSALGPVLGGIFTQTAGWRWCFYINLPIGAVVLVLLVFLLNVPAPKQPFIDTVRSIDWIGSIFIVGGTIAFLYGLETGSSKMYPWNSAIVIGLLAGGMAMFILFILFEWHLAGNPVLPVKIFATRATLACLGVASCHALAFIAYDYFLPLYFQIVLGFRPTISGVLLLVLVVPLSFMSAATGFYLKKTGNFRSTMSGGLALMTLANGLFITFDAHPVWAKLIIFMLIAGLGAGPLFQSPLIALQTHLRPSDMAPGTSGLTFLRSLFTSISIVVGGVLLQSGLGSDTFLSHSPGESQLPPEEKSRYASALGNMWIFYTAICGLGLLLSLLIPKVPKRQDADQAGASEDVCTTETRISETIKEDSVPEKRQTERSRNP